VPVKGGVIWGAPVHRATWINISDVIAVAAARSSDAEEVRTWERRLEEFADAQKIRRPAQTRKRLHTIVLARGRGRPPKYDTGRIKQLLAQGVKSYRIALDPTLDLDPDDPKSFKDRYHAVRAVASSLKRRSSS
jgi:hypothetical protein